MVDGVDRRPIRFGILCKGEIQSLVMRQTYPVPVIGPHAQDVAHDVDLEHVEVLVDGREEECLQLVRASLDFVSVRLLGVREGVAIFGCFRCFGFALRRGGGAVGRWPEAK